MATDPQTDTDAFEAAAARIDGSLNAHRKGCITNAELVDSIRAAIRTAVNDHDDPNDDLGLLVDYARCSAEAVLADPRRGDRAQLDVLDRGLALELEHPVVEMRAELLIEDVDHRLQSDRAAGVDRLVELCATGGNEHPDIFVLVGPGRRVIELAITHRVPAALEAAITPRGAGWAQLGHPRRDDGQAHRMAFDGLAMIATQVAEPASAEAIDALVRLCEHPTIAVEAIVRLPVHLLTRAHRDALATCLARYVDWTAAPPSVVQFHPETLRIPHMLRSVLWLAGDLEANRDEQ